MRTIQGDMIGSGLRFAIIGSRFNELITSKLIEGAKDALSRHGVSFSDIDLYWDAGRVGAARRREGDKRCSESTTR